MNDFQCHVYENKPGLVLLTETWFTKEHLHNEIFPKDTYRCYRVDRTARTHSSDPLNKTKVRENEGVILIAVRADLNVGVKEIAIKSLSKAEIISLELNFGSNEIVCIVLVYHVGTLGVPNFLKIENHLRKIAQTRNFSEQIIEGDLISAEPHGPLNQEVNPLTTLKNVS